MIIKSLILLLCLIIASMFFIPNEETITISACFTTNQNCTAFVADYISSHNVTCAFYELNEPIIIEALKNTTVLIDDDNAHKSEYKNLIPIHMSGLMHHKFCTDGKSIFTGSLNPTKNGFYKNNNHALIIENEKIAKMYQKEIINLKNNSRTPTSITIKTENISIEAIICRKNCNKKIVDEIHKSKRSVNFMIFTFTEKSVLYALLDAKTRNITIQGIVEKRSASHDAYRLLSYQDINISFDKNPATMHHKVFIIDNKTVVAGSFNPTKNADERNAENIVIMKSNVIAKWYLEEFDRIS
jgi:phosphatidylserine/phosphatidylglycerophosphate/cardiolipin synthase-like enzyme